METNDAKSGKEGRRKEADLLVRLDVLLVLLDDLLDLLLHRVESLSVRLGRLLGSRLLELERVVDIGRESGEGGEELGRHEDGRSREGGEVGLLEEPEDLVELC